MTVPTLKNTKDDDDMEDPVDRMLKQTGCMELHYKVQVYTFNYQFYLKIGS